MFFCELHFSISFISHFLHFFSYPYLFSFLTLMGLMQWGPTSLKMENEENILLTSSATHLGPSPPSSHFHPPFSAGSCLGRECCCLPLDSREKLVELNCNNFSFSVCSHGPPRVYPLLFHTTTHNDVHMPGLVVQNLVCSEFLVFRSVHYFYVKGFLDLIFTALSTYISSM